MSNTTFYTIGIAFMSGIFLRSFLNVDIFSILFVLFVGVALLIASRIASKSQAILTLALLFIFLSLGMFRLHSAETEPSLLSAYENQEIELIGRVAREPEQRETTMHLYLKPQIGREEISEYVLVTTELFRAKQEGIAYGDVITVTGTLVQPEAFESNGGREFDYPGYLKTKGVTYMMKGGELGFIQKGDNSFLSTIYKGKERFQNALEHILPMPHAGLGEGILLGVKRALGKDLEETFRETGIIHIVVLSGYNIMIVVEAMMFMLAFFFLPRMRMIIGIAAIVLFVLLVGPSATVVRASLMASLLLIARATGRLYAILRALLLAGVVMLIVNPHLLVHDPGFQLSFMATLALIVLAPHVEKRLLMIPEKFGIRMIVTATVTTQIFVLPLLLYHMGLLSFVSVLVNVLVLPMVPIAMLLTFLTGMFGIFLAPLGTLFGFVTYYSLGYIIGISEFFGSLSFASTSIVKFPAWIMFVAYGLMTLGIVFLTKRDSQETVHLEVGNKYSDWTIEEEVEETGDSQSESPAGSLPFR